MVRSFVVAEQFQNLGDAAVSNIARNCVNRITNSPTNANRTYPTGLVWTDGGGFGQIPFEEEVSKAKETISPWLWAFSIAGFAMAVMNTRRISKMFGSWKKARKALR